MDDIRTGDLTGSRTLTKIQPIKKGWSDDKKYYVETDSGEKLLLRVSDISEMEDKKYEFELMKRFAAVHIPMSQPVEFGICSGGRQVYQLLTWCEGEEAKEVLPSLSRKEQYSFGWKAGQILKKMQEVERHAPSDDWADEYGRKVRRYLEDYRACKEKLAGDELLISFMERHKSCLRNRPTCLLHADFQSDNMVISPDNELYIIDFQGSGVVDPYYALTGVMVTAEVSPLFSVGQLHSYFDGQVPEDFWELNAFYMAAESIRSFAVAVKLGQEEVEYSNEMMKTTFAWYGGGDSLIPSWYSDREP